MGVGNSSLFGDLPDGGRRLLELAVAACANAVIVTDATLPDGPAVYANPAAERITGYPVEELLGRNPRFLQGPYSDLEEVAELRRAMAEGREFYGVLRNRRKDGSDFFNEMYVAPVRNADGTVTHFVGIQNDVTERRHLEEELEHRAFHDPLTGLPNRALFLDRLGHALARAGRDAKWGGDGEVAVMFLDLDRFKNVNDSLGHASGDALLVEAAGRIGGCLRPGDTVARLGGDEFAVLLEDAGGEAGAVEVSGRIAVALAPPVEVGGGEVFVTPSIGVTLAVPGEGTPDDLLREADAAMYEAKARGRDRHAVFRPEMRAASVGRLELEGDLRRALGDPGRAFRLFYQPQVRLRDGGVAGFEALVRWEHPSRGLLLPGEFVPLAEETGLIVPLGLWVLREACRQAGEWRSLRAGAGRPPLTMSVNLSARQLREPALAGAVAEALGASGTGPEDLVLEITESILVEDLRSAVPALRALRSSGVRIAIDDFGTGYSNLSYLKRLPVDHLKLDRSIVAGIDRDRTDLALAASALALARALGLGVVAEGVETRGEAEKLGELGCELGQGFYWRRPEPPEEARLLVANPRPAPEGA